MKQTLKYTSGHSIRAVIVPLVCDLPAARKMAGIGGHMFRFFCSECWLSSAAIENINPEEWEYRTCTDHRQAAQRWKNASTNEEQRLLFLSKGIRWSELLWLPYWDLTLYVAIDSMHCFYLGLCRRHVIDIWGMSTSTPDGEGPSFQTREITVRPGVWEYSKVACVWNESLFDLIITVSGAFIGGLCHQKYLRYNFHFSTPGTGNFFTRTVEISLHRVKLWGENYPTEIRK